MNTKFTTYAVLCFVLISSSAFALDVQLFRPNFDEEGGIVVQNAQTISEGRYRPNLFVNWVRNPIEFGRTVNDKRVDTLIGWFMTADAMFAAGIRDDLTVGIDLPFNVGNKIEGINQFQQKQRLGIGDLMLYAKYRLREKNDEEPGFFPAVAVLPFLSIPTGSNDVFFGNKNVTGGFKAILDWRLAARHFLSANLGVRLRQKETILNLSVGQEFTGAFGYTYNLWLEKKLDMMIEMFGSTDFSKFATEEITSPVEILLGFQQRLVQNRLLAKAGVSQGINNGYGAPDIRVFFGATYIWGQNKNAPEKPISQPAEPIAVVAPEPPPPAPVVPPPPPLVPEAVSKKISFQGNKWVLANKVYFEIGKSVIMEKSKPILAAIIVTLEANPQIKQIKIEGYTDSKGDDANNLRLSQHRADSVRNYMIKEGIAPDRLSSQGHGESSPVDTNDTPRGRENNRRVDFTIVDESDTQ